MTCCYILMRTGHYFTGALDLRMRSEFMCCIRHYGVPSEANGCFERYGKTCTGEQVTNRYFPSFASFVEVEIAVTVISQKKRFISATVCVSLRDELGEPIWISRMSICLCVCQLINVPTFGSELLMR